MEGILKGKQSQTLKKLKPFIKLNNGKSEDVHYSLFYSDLPEEFKTCAKNELKETEENKKKGIQRLKDIIKRENITNVDDSSIMFILRSSKYDFSKAEAKLMKFHKSYRKMLRMVAEIDLEVVEQILDLDVFGFLPYRDKYGRAIYFTRHSLSPVISTCTEDVIVLGMMMSYLLNKYSPISSVAGMSSVASHKDIPLLHYYALLKVFKRHISIWLSLPMRYRRRDVTNEHPFTRFFYKIIRPLTPAKFNERIHFHGSDHGTLLQFYHPDLLPEEFGGNLGPIRQFSFREEMLNLVKILKENPEANI